MEQRFVGVDWASERHAVCVINERGEVKERLVVPHTRLGLAELTSRLAKHAAPAELPVGIERPDGPVVDALAAAGFPVVIVPPHVVKAARPRFSVARAKSDPGDARLLADLVRTDGGRFRRLRPTDPETARLRRLVRARDELRDTRTLLGNQLRMLLEEAWPGAAEVFARVDSPIASRSSSPHAARGLGEARLAAFLVRHHYSGRRSAGELVARLRAAPVVSEPAIVDEATADGVRSLVACLRTLLAGIGADRGGSRPPMRSRPKVARPRSLVPRANRASSPSAGRATSACASRSRRSPTTAGGGTPGRLTCTRSARSRSGPSTCCRRRLKTEHSAPVET